MRKRAELRIQEMSFMLLAVVVFFVIVGLFAIMIFYNTLYKEARQIEESRTLTAATYLADTPEFNCVDTMSNCIDGDKLVALIGKTNYTKLWPFSSLSVVRFHAFEKTEAQMVECTISNYPQCDIFEVYDKQVSDESVVSAFVALCITEYEQGHFKKCEVAKILAGTEQEFQGRR
jgi:hypothetical protein